MKEIYKSLSRTVERLEEILQQEKTVANRDSAIKRFELTVELAWKSLQTFLREQGIPCRSPKECLTRAFEYGLIENDPRWIAMFDDRNMTVHTYDERDADEVYNRLPSYLALLQALQKQLMERQS
ncbi:MAG TPA: HI0074 family nucleotidyltransferase substrate-binding subunit [Bacteroidota bacterium]|nr:HI0074 family nucleotidyltransferase substrate-binding subunit [Bacteroidota bacterium]